MKTRISVLLLFLCAALLHGCGQNADYVNAYDTTPDYAHETTPVPTPSPAPVPPTPEPGLPIEDNNEATSDVSAQEIHYLRWASYIQQFMAYYPPQDEHTRKWSYDIQQFRNHIFAHHAKFNVYPNINLPRNIAMGEAIDTAAIALLGSVPYLDDFSIKMEIQRIAAILRDNHFIPWQLQHEPTAYPLEFRWLANGFYLIATNEQHTAALSQKVTAINNEPIDDVFEMYYHLMSVENIYDARYRLAAQMRYPAVIRALGLYQDGTVYSFNNGICIALTANHEIEFEFGITEVSFGGEVHGRIPIQLPVQSLHANYTPLFLSTPDIPGASVRWHTFIEDTGILYIRLHDYNHSIIGFWIEDGILHRDSTTPDGPARPFNRMVRDTFDANDVRAVVIDARGNPGGYVDHYSLFRFLSENVESGMLFHFFDEGSLSASLWAGDYLERLGAISVGQPMGQATEFYYFHGSASPAWDINLNYSRLNMRVPNRVWSAHPDIIANHEGNIFRPQVLIPHMIYDWVRGHDPLMAYVVERIS